MSTKPTTEARWQKAYDDAWEQSYRLAGRTIQNHIDRYPAGLEAKAICAFAEKEANRAVPERVAPEPPPTTPPPATAEGHTLSMQECVNSLSANANPADALILKAASDELAKLREVNKGLVEALSEVLTTCEAGVIHRNETGKPQWSAFDHLKKVVRAALARAKE